MSEPTMPAGLAEILAEPGWVCDETSDYCTREFGGYLGITVETIRGRHCVYVEDGDGNVYPNHIIHQVSEMVQRAEQAALAQEGTTE